MAEAGGGGGGECFIFEGTPVSQVSVTVEGLRGEARAAAVAAASSIQSAHTVGAVNDSVCKAASAISAAAGPNAAAIEVTSPPGDGSVAVAFKAAPGSLGIIDGGLRSPQGFGITTCASAETESDMTLATGRGSIGGAFDFGSNSMFASARIISSLRIAGWAPGFEVGTRLPGPGFCEPPAAEQGDCNENDEARPRTARAPHQVSPLFASLSLVDATGCHAFRAQAALRDLIPVGESSADLIKKNVLLKSTKASLGYSFLRETRPGDGDIDELYSASAELAGGLGDVSLARAEATWTRTERNWAPAPELEAARKALGFGGLILNASATIGFALPLEGALPYEERCFLGGALGGPNQRLPGFAVRSLGCQKGDGVGRLTAGASVRTEIPHAGDLQALAFGQFGAISSTGSSGVNIVRASVGLGVGHPLPNGGLLGVTLAQPLNSGKQDQLQPVQLSLSFSSAE